MRIGTNAVLTAGNKIQFLREAKAWSREELAHQAGIGVNTLRDIETGVRNAQPKTVQKLAKALAVQPAELQVLQVNATHKRRDARLYIKATRFIPLFDNGVKNSSAYVAIAKLSPRSIEYQHFPDGFSMIIAREILEFMDFVHMLSARREVHLNILQHRGFSHIPNCEHPIYLDQAPAIDYVMSVHQLVNAREHDDTTICAICEPSWIGITDDPQQDSVPPEVAHRNISNVCPESNVIHKVATGDSCFYVSWSNVILADSEPNSCNYSYLEQLELTLQKLWFQVNTYDTYVDNCIQEPSRYDIKSVLREIKRARLQVANFCKVASTGAGHSNSLKSALAMTSRIEDISNSLNEKMKMLET